MKLWQELRNNFVRRRFLFRVILLTGGTIAGQGAFVVLSPLLSRLYSPAAFGVYGIFVSTVGVLVPIATLRYELAIPLPPEEREAQSLAWAGILVTGVFGVLLGIISFTFGFRYLSWLKVPSNQLSQWRFLLFIIPLGVTILSMYQILSYLLIRHQNFRALAGSKAANGGVGAVSQAILAFLLGGGVGLILGWLLGWLAAISVAVNAERRQRVDTGWFLPFPDPEFLVKEMRRFVRFPLLTMPASLMNAASVELPLLMSASLFGPQVAGWFAFARRVIYLPMGLLGRSISQVYIGTLSDSIRRSDRAALRLFDRLSRRLFFSGTFLFAVLALVAPWTFRWIFGESWYESGILVRYLAPAYIAHFVTVPLSQTLNLLERQDWQIAWDTTRLGLIAGVFLLAKILAWDFEFTFMVYSAISTSMYLVFYLLTRKALMQRIFNRGFNP